METGDAPRRLRVLEVVRPPDGTTRYIDQVVGFADDDIWFSYISPGHMLRGDQDVVHFHWPEMIVRHRLRAVESMKSALLRLWIRSLRRRRIAIVRTLHNLHPHEDQRPAVRRALTDLDRATDLFVAINPTTPLPDGGVRIPHGHYRDRFALMPRSEPRAGRILYAGMIRPYKGVEGLLSSFEALDDPSLTLRIVGRPTADLREAIEGAVARRSDRVSARLDFVPDDDFVAEISAAELVCLPYRELHNSGMVLVALSLGRPVLVPETESMRALAEEVGPGWVLTFRGGELRPEDLVAALAATRDGARQEAPRLDDRDWQQVGARYSAAFRSARERVRGR